MMNLHSTETLQEPSGGNRLLVGSFCATFLKPEMRHIYRQIKGLERYQTVVFTQSRENAEEYPFSPLVELPKVKTRSLRRMWQKQLMRGPIQIYSSEASVFLRKMEAFGIQLLHVYFGHIGIYLLPLLRKSPWPVVVSFHGADVGVDMEKPVYRKAMKEVLSLAKLVLVRSRSLEEGLIALGCPKEKIHLQRTGIPLGSFEYKERIFPKDGEWHFIQACRLIPKKGLDHTLEAFAIFKKSNPAARLTIAGEGPLLTTLEAQVKRLKLTRSVSFPGFLGRKELLDLYYDAHVFVHPSRTDAAGNQEGVPNSMLEAMATGLPVVATRHGGIPEAVTDAMGGFLCFENDLPGLLKSMQQLTDNRERYLSMGKVASSSVRERFEQRKQIAQLEVLYDKALG